MIATLALVVGARLTPAPRREIVAALEVATRAPRSACGSAVAHHLTPDGSITEAVISLYHRAAALDSPGPGAFRCPRCLGDAPMVSQDRCRACDPRNDEQLAEYAAIREARREYRKAAKAADAPPTPVPEVPAATVLDRFDLEDVKAMCATKRAYVSQIEADRMARACEAKRGKPLRAYPCPACSHWHITKAADAPEHLR